MRLYPLIEFGNFPIYNLMGGLGFILGLILFLHNLKDTRLNNIQKDRLVTIYGMAFLIGMFFANFLNWFVFPDLLKYSISYRFYYGGFTFYFGLVGFLLTSTVLLKGFKFNVYESINILIPSILLFHGFGRIGCILGGCCYGKITNYNLLNLFTISRFPVREMEAISVFILFFIAQFVIKKNRHIFYFYTYPIVRFLLEFGRGDDRGKLFTAFLSPSQEISILLVVFVSLFLINKKDNKRELDSNSL